MVTDNQMAGFQGIDSLNKLHTQVFSRLKKKLDPPEKIVVRSPSNLIGSHFTGRLCKCHVCVTVCLSRH